MTMNINDLMSDLGIPAEPENSKPEKAAKKPASAPKRRQRVNTPPPAPKPSAAPESEQPNHDILRPQMDPWQRLMSLAPAETGCQFKHGISRYGKPYAFWKVPGQGKPVNLTAEVKEAWEECQGPNLQEVIARAWRMANTAKAEGYYLSAGSVQELKDAYQQARILDKRARELQADDSSEAPKLEAKPAAQLEKPSEPAESEPASGLATETQAPSVATVELPDALAVAEAQTDSMTEFDAAYAAFRSSRDLSDAARLQKAMTRILQEGF